MDPKTDLLVFSKKEVFVIISLLILVALFSFTMGLKLGKNLGATTTTAQQSGACAQPPLHAEDEAEAAKDSHAKDSSSHGEDALTPVTKSAPAMPKTSVDKIEEKADSELAHETEHSKAGLGKKLPMAFPRDKISATDPGSRFTLQVGSHRTVAEAAEQVSVLKHKDLDAFYLEANIKGKGTWYRVGIGVFQTKEEAESTAAKWKESKVLPPFIVQKIN